MQSTLLPPEFIQIQLSQVDLLTAMYPGDGEISMDEATKTSIRRLEAWCQNTCNDNEHGSQDVGRPFQDLDGIPEYLSLLLNLTIGSDTREETIEVHVDVPTQQPQNTPLKNSEPEQTWKIRLRQPGWLNRAQTAHINTIVAHECEEADVFSAIERLREQVANHLTTPSEHDPHTPSISTPKLPQPSLRPHPQPEQVRVWFYFPSLSTRSKRDDLVNSAPHYRLTGFVLAGKPGILCLEGTSRDVDDYMKYIKTESWGDIPSHQKKVSERYRETLGATGRDGGSGRVFADMQEITDQEWMGEKRGERGNRSDLRVLEGWLKEKGLEGVLQKVLM